MLLRKFVEAHEVLPVLFQALGGGDLPDRPPVPAELVR